MMNRFLSPLRSVRRFARDEEGAITVDWVVLTAGITAFIMLLFSILTETIFEDVAVAINDNISEASSR